MRSYILASFFGGGGVGVGTCSFCISILRSLISVVLVFRSSWMVDISAVLLSRSSSNISDRSSMRRRRSVVEMEAPGELTGGVASSSVMS